MNSIKLLLIICLFCLFANCSSNNKVSKEEESAITKEIQLRMAGYTEAIKRKDLAWFHGFWSNEKDFVFAGDGIVNTDYADAITKDYSDAFNSIKEWKHLNWSNGHALVLSKDAVSYATNFDFEAILNSGDTLNGRGAWLYLFRKSGSNWRVVHSAGTHIYK